MIIFGFLIKSRWVNFLGFKRNSFVDFLKGLAISAVILLHAFEWPEPLLGFLQFAVPVFILLMAYNFSQSWQAKPFLKRYLFRRAKRLLPVFLAAWFFVVFVALIFNTPFRLGGQQLIGFFVLPGGRKLFYSTGV